MKKVSELTEANEINDEDIVMIIQNGENRQVKASSLLIHTYTMTIEADTELGAEVELPFWYKVGNGSLFQVQYNEYMLLKAIDSDLQGQYYEVGQVDELSNKIRLATDAKIKAR